MRPGNESRSIGNLVDLGGPPTSSNRSNDEQIQYVRDSVKDFCSVTQEVAFTSWLT
jgi:hypothetical protein